MARHAITAALALALSLAPLRASADGLALSRADALRLGADRGPATVEARAPLGAARGIRDAAKAPLAYSPRVSVIAGARRGAFGAGPELGGTVLQDLSVRGLGGARTDVGAAYARASATDVDRARLEAGATALLAWIDVLEAQELVAFRHRARADAEAIARVARARVDRGVAMPVEASLAAAEVGSAELAELDAEGQLVAARVALRFAVGLPPTTDVRAIGTLDADRAPADRDPSREHPAAAAARTRVALAAAEAKLARAQSSAPMSVGVQVMREGTGEQVLTGQITLPLPFLDPSRFEGARQQAHVLAAEARERRIKDEIARDVALADHERAHTREVREALREKVLVPLREAVRVARAAYEAGTQDATALLLLRQRLVAAEEQLERALAEVQRADVRYAVARGVLLDEAAR
jgi:outer membrane protein TolC